MTSLQEGAPMRRSGYALTLFRKEPDGRWVLFRDANRVTAETPVNYVSSAKMVKIEVQLQIPPLIP